jgi:hypothetical protein
MSKVVKIKSQLRKEKNKAFLMVLLSFLFVLICFASGVGILVSILLEKSTIHIAIPILILILALIFIIVFFTCRKKYDILKAGVRGENATLKILKKLPKDFTVITNPVILNRGIKMELDFLVIGKNSVFIVETKNHRGILSGKTSNAEWHQVKHSKNGKVYEKDISNPIKQSFRQCRRMEELFRDFDITATVYSVLFFVDSRTELKILDDAQMNVAIFNDEESMLDYIENTKGKNTISQNELIKIKQIFKK